MQAYNAKQKDEYKLHVSAAFYAAYFNLKGQKGLKGSDLSEVLAKIDGNKEMSEYEILEACKSML